MQKETVPLDIGNFNFSSDGPSAFEMISAGAFTFEVPTSESARPLFQELSNPMASSVNAPLAKVLSFEARIARRQNPAIKVDISRRDWLVKEIKNNQHSVVRLAEVAMAAARRQQENCATDGHANTTTSSLESISKFSASPRITSIVSKEGHKEGKHDHCGNCGSDLTEGKCSKCAA